MPALWIHSLFFYSKFDGVLTPKAPGSNGLDSVRDRRTLGEKVVTSYLTHFLRNSKYNSAGNYLRKSIYLEITLYIYD